MVEPYGGHLVDRQVSDAERDRRDGELRDLPTVRPLIDQLYDAEKIGIGAYSPLDGFMDSASIASVLSQGRLPNGLPWSIPIHFPIPADPSVTGLGPGDAVGLLDPSDRLVGVLHIDETFPLDRAAIARGTYGTDDPNLLKEGGRQCEMNGRAAEHPLALAERRLDGVIGD